MVRFLPRGQSPQRRRKEPEGPDPPNHRPASDFQISKYPTVNHDPTLYRMRVTKSTPPQMKDLPLRSFLISLDLVINISKWIKISSKKATPSPLLTFRFLIIQTVSLFFIHTEDHRWGNPLLLTEVSCQQPHPVSRSEFSRIPDQFPSSRSLGPCIFSRCRFTWSAS